MFRLIYKNLHHLKKENIKRIWSQLKSAEKKVTAALTSP